MLFHAVVLAPEPALDTAETVVEGRVHVGVLFLRGHPEVLPQKRDLDVSAYLLDLEDHMHGFDLERVLVQLSDLLVDVIPERGGDPEMPSADIYFHCNS